MALYVLCNQTVRVMAVVICESVGWAESGVPGAQISSLYSCSLLLMMAKTAE